MFTKCLFGKCYITKDYFPKFILTLEWDVEFLCSMYWPRWDDEWFRESIVGRQMNTRLLKVRGIWQNLKRELFKCNKTFCPLPFCRNAYIAKGFHVPMQAYEGDTRLWGIFKLENESSNQNESFSRKGSFDQ